MQCCRKYPQFIVDYLTLNVAYLKMYTSGKMALAYNRAVYGEERQIGATQPENTKKMKAVFLFAQKVDNL